MCPCQFAALRQGSKSHLREKLFNKIKLKKSNET